MILTIIAKFSFYKKINIILFFIFYLQKKQKKTIFGAWYVKNER